MTKRILACLLIFSLSAGCNKPDKVASDAKIDVTESTIASVQDSQNSGVYNDILAYLGSDSTKKICHFTDGNGDIDLTCSEEDIKKLSAANLSSLGMVCVEYKLDEGQSYIITKICGTGYKYDWWHGYYISSDNGSCAFISDDSESKELRCTAKQQAKLAKVTNRLLTIGFHVSENSNSQPRLYGVQDVANKLEQDKLPETFYGYYVPVAENESACVFRTDASKKVKLLCNSKQRDRLESMTVTGNKRLEISYYAYKSGASNILRLNLFDVIMDKNVSNNK